MATGPDGAIDEDVYCLGCGYNLRGLSGEPVRCPECGELNSLGVVAIPASLSHSGIRHTETAPTRCAGSALGLLVTVPFLFVVRGYARLFPVGF